jgi:hypothetical protein
MLDRLAEWEHLGTWVVALSILAFVGSLAVLPLLVVRMPADYFVHPEPKPGGWRDRHPAIRLAGHVLKNAIGVILVAAGVVMPSRRGRACSRSWSGSRSSPSRASGRSSSTS